MNGDRMSNQVSRETYLAAVNRITKLEAAIRQWASECAECQGTGLVTIHNFDGHGSDADDQPCPDCAEILEYLK